MAAGTAVVVAGLAAAAVGGGAAQGRAEADPVPEPMHVYLGTTHAHTGADNDHGQDGSHAAEVFAAARESGLDFLALTEHSGPTGPRDPEAFYADVRAQAAAATETGVFVGLAGYEYSENGGDGDADHGHLTAVGGRSMISGAARDMGFGAFFSAFAADSDPGAFLGFNHPPADGHPAAAGGPPSAEVRDLVALTETGNGGTYDADEAAAFYAGYVAELDLGWRVAPTCGLDSHGLYVVRQQETEDKKPCRAGVLAPSLDRAEVLEAIGARRVYATQDVNLRARYSANGRWMGAELGATDELRLDVRLRDPDTDAPEDRIRRIEVVGDGGRVLASHDVDDHKVRWRTTVDVGSSTYAFVRVFTGERPGPTAVLAPVWFD